VRNSHHTICAAQLLHAAQPVTIDRNRWSRSPEYALKDWWAAGTALLWVPIIDVDGTPDSVAAGRELAAELDGGWLIHRPADLLTLPEGLKGWLLPLNADDTNVVCGRWRTEITFMQITDRHTGAVATFQSTVAQTERNEVVK